MPIILSGGDAVAGDFDRDGRVDLAVASYFAQRSSRGGFGAAAGVLTLLLGDGQGGLEGSPPPVTVLDDATAIAVEDLDNDGIPDAAVVETAADRVSVLLSSGNGNLTFAGSHAVGSLPVDVAVARLDGGATADLLVASEGASEVGVLLGNGDGTFAAATPVALGRAPSALAVGDLNENGIVDVVTANAATDDISVLLGLGAGAFGAPTHIDVGDTPMALAVGHLNADDFLDLVVANNQSADVSVFLGNGDGSMGPEKTFVAGLTPVSVVLADLDDNGDQDVIVGSDGILKPAVTVLLGDGLGGLAAPVTVDAGERVSEVAAADVTGDGHMDIVAGHKWSYSTVIPGRGDGTFDSPLHFVLPGSRVSVGLADVTDDGRIDLLFANEFGDTVGVRVNGLPLAVRFDDDASTLTWIQLVGDPSFNVYRGDLGALSDSDLDGLPDLGFGACRNGLDPVLTDSAFEDEELPISGQGFFYLVARATAAGELELGATSSGLARTPTAPCP